MKKSEIGRGRFYSDGKLGLREVLDEGSQYKRYAGVEDDDCLRYRCLNAKSSSDIGQEANSTRIAFAAWAKEEVPADKVQEHLLTLQAEKIAKNLTEHQRRFLRTFDCDLGVGTSVECGREEHRVALSCLKKGVIGTMPERLESAERCFDVYFSPLGLAVLAKVLGVQDGDKC